MSSEQDKDCYHSDAFPQEPCQVCGDAGADWYRLDRQDDPDGLVVEEVRSWWICKECAEDLPDTLDVILERL